MKKVLSALCLISFLCADQQPSYTLSEIPTSIIDGEAPSALKTPLRKKKSTFAAVGLSGIMPGLGHAYLGDMKEAGALAGSFATGIAVGRGQDSDMGNMSAMEIVATSWSYGLYASYRDARTYNGEHLYSYQMPQDSFSSLSLASFNPSILKKKEVWGGLIGALAVATGVTYFATSKISCSSVGHINPVFAFPTGVAEESLFRGYMQSALSEVSNPTLGILGSSLLFGAAHIPNGFEMDKYEQRSYYTFGIPFITAFGAYFGYLTHKNHSLKEAVALHAWYDFTLFLLASLATEATVNSKPSFCFTFDF